MDDDVDRAATEAAYRVLADQAGLVRDSCLEVNATLGTLGDALQVVAAGGSQEWAGFGIVSLPIMASLRAVKGLASQYVKQQTGVALGDWTDFVTRAGDQFDGYLDRLDRVRSLARDRLGAVGPQPVAGTVAAAAATGDGFEAVQSGALRLEAARADIEEVRAARWETQAWKVVLGRVAQLGRVVDAVLQVESDVQAAEAEASPEQSQQGGFGGLQRRLKEVQHRTMDRSTDLRAWVLHPFLDVRDRARALPQQVDRLAHDVGLLELLLDLLEAQLRIEDGSLAAEDVRVVRLRVAASVELPALADALAAARARVHDLEAWLARLDEAGRAGQVPEAAARVLAEDYRVRGEDARAEVARLVGLATPWQREGEAVLDSCRAWVELQLAVLDARALAGEVAPSPERRALLVREGERLDEARGLLAALGTAP